MMKQFEQEWIGSGAALAVLIGALFTFGGACDRGAKKDPDPAPASADAGAEESGKAVADVEVEAKEIERLGPRGPAVFMLAGLKGYTEPCGCTLDIMLGGIDRIVAYADGAAPLYEGHIFVDGGNLFFEYPEYDETEIPQEKARVDVIIEGLKAANVQATVPGKLDMALGAEFYLDAASRADVTPISINATVGGKALEGVRRMKAGDNEIIVIGVNDPAELEETEGIEASDPFAAMKRALADLPDDDTPILALVQGELGFTKKLLAANPKLDFGLVGVSPRMTDQVDEAGEGHTLEAYDQGRHFGILTLFGQEGDSTWESARTGSDAELRKIEDRIAHLERNLDRLPPDKSGNVTPMALNLRGQIDDLEKRKREIVAANVTLPEDESAFVWNSVALEPGYPRDPSIKEVRLEFNKSLEELNKKIEREVIPVADGEPFYIGNAQCAQCHGQAHDFWKETGHGDALATLQERDKAWDQSCIGCHVVGYEKPGGSVLGELQYTAEITLSEGTEPVKFEKDLRNVGCESCHGPGSAHRISPVDSKGNPHNIALGSGEDVCMQCHVPDHSPRFEYDNYVEQITGPGHELRSE